MTLDLMDIILIHLSKRSQQRDSSLVANFLQYERIGKPKEEVKEYYKFETDEKGVMHEIMTKGPVTAVFIVYGDFLYYKGGVYVVRSSSYLFVILGYRFQIARLTEFSSCNKFTLKLKFKF
ncbi:unnamed protein product [Strongylus vulgaris]|uniref:Peptidase C1A papain C-terminal domain-containing protein n=1 Tax=Strongylus vulgaris TaxID=40348 RepID=A0A3P7LQK3_STRVU|nr:unnamed protein product [Strongylus vulgaris]